EAPCIVLVDLSLDPASPPWYRDGAAVANASYAARAAADPERLALAPWSQVSAGHTDWFTDGIHHTPAGEAAYLATISDAARSRPAAGRCAAPRAPAAPRAAVPATLGGAAVGVAWEPPASAGGAPVERATVTARDVAGVGAPHSVEVPVPSSSATLTGLSP